MASALPLVTEVEGTYLCDPDGLAFLRGCNCPVAVVVIAGKYRTGKSFLLNRGILRLSPKQGFATGNTVNACTKGIWVYSKLLKLQGVTTQAVVLDTEGMGSMEASPQHDAKLISIAVCLASLFVYNSTGALDEASFSDIGVIAHAAKSLQVQSGEHWQPPALLWAIRDFALILADTDGEEITPNAYLERCLKEPDKGESRDLLRTYFTQKTLFPFVRPVADEEKLHRLNSLTSRELRPEFVKQLTDFSSVVSSLSDVKTIGGRPATGVVLSHLCEVAVKALNEGAVPSVADSFSFLLEGQARGAIEEARVSIRASMELLAARIPCPPEQLHIDRPTPPGSLIGYTSVEGMFNAEIEKICQAEEVRLETRNGAERAKWLRDVMDRMQRTHEPLRAFLEFLQTAHETLGIRHAHESAALVFESCLEAGEKEVHRLREAAYEARGREESVARKLQGASNRNDEMRAELEEALVAQLAQSVVSPNLLELDTEREHSRLLEAELLSTSEIAHSATREMEESNGELSLLRHVVEEAASARALQNAEDLQTLLSLEQTETQQVTELRDTLLTQKEEERARLSCAQEEMMGHVVAARNRFYMSEEQACKLATEESSEVAALRLRLETAQQEEVSAASTVSRLEADIHVCEEKFVDELAQMKRQHTQILFEKTQFMRDAHEQNLAELRRTRERATESDRAKVRLEIENQSNKRAFASHREDLDQLAKARRHSEDLRERLSDRDSAARTSSSMLDDARQRIAALEDRLREVEAAHSQEIRNKDYKLAVLEVKLLAHPTARDL